MKYRGSMEMPVAASRLPTTLTTGPNLSRVLEAPS